MAMTVVVRGDRRDGEMMGDGRWSSRRDDSAVGWHQWIFVRPPCVSGFSASPPRTTRSTKQMIGRKLTY